MRIPPGIAEGQAVRVRGEGEPPPREAVPSGSADGMRGDLHVVIRVKDHDMFQREGNHLVMEMPISFTQASLGAELEVPTLDGRETITVPRATQHDTLFRINNAGLPDLRSGRRGDLVVVTKIESHARSRRIRKNSCENSPKQKTTTCCRNRTASGNASKMYSQANPTPPPPPARSSLSET